MKQHICSFFFVLSVLCFSEYAYAGASIFRFNFNNNSDYVVMVDRREAFNQYFCLEKIAECRGSLVMAPHSSDQIMVYQNDKTKKVRNAWAIRIVHDYSFLCGAVIFWESANYRHRVERWGYTITSPDKDGSNKLCTSFKSQRVWHKDLPDPYRYDVYYKTNYYDLSIEIENP